MTKLAVAALASLVLAVSPSAASAYRLCSGTVPAIVIAAIVLMILFWIVVGVTALSQPRTIARSDLGPAPLNSAPR